MYSFSPTYLHGNLIMDPQKWDHFNMWHVFWDCHDLENWPLSTVLVGTWGIEQSCHINNQKQLKTFAAKQKIFLD